jgi:integrase
VAKVAGYLEQRRAGFSAVVDVPPSKREAVGSKRLKKGLATRDKHVAKARLAKALLELHARIDAACRRNADTDPVTAEAMAYREQMEVVRKPGGSVYQPETVWDPATGTELVVEVDIAEDIVRETVEARGEEIAAQEGSSRAKAFADIAMGRATPLKHHVETWLSEPGKRGTVRAPRTVMEYRAMLDSFALWLGGEGLGSTLEGVTRVVAGRYVSSLHKQSLSPARMRDILAALSTYWGWLEARGFARRGGNPWKEQDIPKVQKAQALRAVTDGDDEDDGLRPFSDDELVTLFAKAPDVGMRDLMALSALSGMRIAEVCSLTVGQCADGIFDVRGTKTKAARRKVPIHPDLQAIVDQRREGREPDAWLLEEAGEPDKFGKRSPNMSAAFYRFRTRVKVDDKVPGRTMSLVNFHSFRRWFVSEAVKAGTPVHVIRQVVGHEQPKSDVTLSTYFKGELTEAKRACVASVMLPAKARKVLGNEAKKQGAGEAEAA